MPPPNPTLKELNAEFDRIGEARVRRALNLGQFGGWKAKAARHWLAEGERTSIARSREEDRRTARSAKNAAWVAAIAAIIAAAAAIISVVMVL